MGQSARVWSGVVSLAAILVFVGGSGSLIAQTAGASAPSSKAAPSKAVPLKPVQSKPALSIDLADHGFSSTSTWQEAFADDLGLEGYASQVAMEFLDEKHLLVTFSERGLVKRQPECPSSHHDRSVKALLFEVPSGRLLRKVDWYLHDHRRFLWPLNSGALLIRRGDSLYVLDTELHERELLRSTEPLEWVSTTADGKQVVIETKVSPSKSANDSERKAKYELRLMDAANGDVKTTFPLTRPVAVTTTSDGFPDAVAGLSGNTWLVRFGSSPKSRLPVTRVRTACAPTVGFSGGNTMVIARCTSAGTKYVVSSFTNSGRFLWRRRWEEMRWVPLFSRSSSGVRFALSTMVRDAVDENAAESRGGENDRESVWTQHIEVLNSLDGAVVLSVDTKPAIFAGQSFALSSRGLQFAVLRGTTVDVYSLPKPTREEEAKLAAVEADVPGLIPPVDETYEELVQGIDAGEIPERSMEAAAMRESVPAAPIVPPAANAAPVASAPVEGANPVATFRTGTQAVVLEVVATDRKGNPVPGLKQERFSVLEDGTRQNVRSFEEHSSQTKPANEARVKPAAAAATKDSANTFSNVSERRDVDSSTMLVLDLLNTPLSDRQRVREELIKFIKTKPPDENFALCVLGNDLRLVRGFTTDERTLIAGVQERRGNLPSIGSMATTEPNAMIIQDMVRVLQGMPVPNDRLARFAAEAQQSLLDDRSQQQDMRVRATFDAFQQVARYLAGIPGRKNLVWLSSSFPSVIFGAVNGEGTSPYRQMRDWSDDVKRLTNMLAAGHVAVYPVDIRGVQTDSQFDMANMTMPQFNPPGMSPAQDRASTGNLDNFAMRAPNELVSASHSEGLRIGSEHSTMDVIAEQTGGKAFYGSNDLSAAVHSSVQHGTSYYTLSYSPSNRKYNGDFRKIRVKIEGADYKLAYRTGYYAVDPDKPLPDRGGVQATLQSAAMSHGAPESAQVPFTVRVVPAGEVRTIHPLVKDGAKVKDASDVKVQHYIVNYVVSGTQLRFATSADGSVRGEFNFLIKAYDEDGVPVAQTAGKAVSSPNPGQFENIIKAGFRMRQEIDVPVNAASMRLGVEDLGNAHIGTLELALPVPVPKDEPLVRKARALPPVEPE